MVLLFLLTVKMLLAQNKGYMKLKTPSNLKRFYYILKYAKQLVKTKQFTDLTDELHLAHSFNHMYVDAHGYDGVDKNSGELAEYKTCNHRTHKTMAKFNKCGENKAKAQKFYLWDKVSETVGVFTKREIKKYLTSDGMINVQLAPEIKRTLTKDGLAKRKKFLTL